MNQRIARGNLYLPVYDQISFDLRIMSHVNPFDPSIMRETFAWKCYYHGKACSTRFT